MTDDHTDDATDDASDDSTDDLLDEPRYDPEDDPQTAAVEALERFGLSSYAARTFVALASLGTGTARDVSQVSDVPRTRVYDAIDELHDRGLVDVQQSSPKEFWAISAETASRTFERDLQHNTDVLRTALTELEPVERQTEQRGVWTVDEQPAVTSRVVEFIDDAETEVVYMTVEELLTDDVVEALGDAADRDVSIQLGGVSPEVQAQIQDEVPGATMFESLWVWSDSPAARLMMVDGRKTLVSALVNGFHDDPSDARSETAIWGEGETNSLVAVLKAVFTWRLDEARPDS
jgi:sugar-specific transcriptional regulator TrmB